MRQMILNSILMSAMALVLAGATQARAEMGANNRDDQAGGMRPVFPGGPQPGGPNQPLPHPQPGPHPLPPQPAPPQPMPPQPIPQPMPPQPGWPGGPGGHGGWDGDHGGHHGGGWHPPGHGHGPGYPPPPPPPPPAYNLCAGYFAGQYSNGFQAQFMINGNGSQFVNVAIQLGQTTFYGQGSCQEWGNQARISFQVQTYQGPVSGQGTISANYNSAVLQVSQSNGITFTGWRR